MKKILMLLLLAIGLAMGLARAFEIPVTSTDDDDNLGTLRRAINKSNETAPGPNRITFNISSDGAIQVVHVQTQLPDIVVPVIIDGTTEPGYPGTPLIELDGSGTLAPTEGLVVRASGCEIYGLAIHSFPPAPFVLTAAVHVIGSTSLIVRSNYLGLKATGAAGNGEWVGLWLQDSSGSEVGGPAAAGNVISANSWDGVRIQGTLATNNVIENNLIGTDIAGTIRQANGYGVYIIRGDNNRIGGLTAASRNIISGNDSNGVYVLGGCSNLVQGNYIGTDKLGIHAVPNLHSGVHILGSDGYPGANNLVIGNVISGNGGFGVGLTPHLPNEPGWVTNNSINGNLIGVDSGGASPLGNLTHGIVMLETNTTQNFAVSNIIAYNGQDGVYISGTNNFIGAGNSIYNNGHNGVTVVLPGETDSIRTNSIYGNGVMGIDLTDDTRTPNDPPGDCDSDWGANRLQNFPVVTTALHGWNCITVRGTLNSERNTTYALDFFLNTQCGYLRCDCPDGRYFIGSLNTTTDGDGNATFDATFTVQLPTGLENTIVVATATSPWGDTSEFSDCTVVVEPPHFILPPQISGRNVVISWMDDGNEWTLLYANQVSSPVWLAVGSAPSCAGGVCSVTVPIAGTAMFFRIGCPQD